VLKPNGILAVWSYNLLSVSPEMDPILSHFYHGTLAGYWPAERKQVESGYQEIDFPFTEVIPPHFAMQAEWNLEELLSYIATWSAVRGYQAAHGQSPVGRLSDELSRYWDEPGRKKPINWPLSLTIRKKII
jgi:hypothetical protein